MIDKKDLLKWIKELEVDGSMSSHWVNGFKHAIFSVAYHINSIPELQEPESESFEDWYEENYPLTGASKSCLEFAWNAAKAQSDPLPSEPTEKWVSVDDRLPEGDHIAYICCVFKKEAGVLVLPLIFNGGAFGENNQELCWNDYVTHWQPLPSPPIKAHKEK